MATFGYEVKGGETNSEANYVFASLFTCTEAGTANSITVYLFDAATGGKAICGIWKGSDKSLVGTTEELNIADGFNNWQIFDFVVEPALTAQTYWLGCITDFLCFRYKADGDANQEAYDSYTYNSALPATLAPDGYFADKLNIYCTYTPGGGGVTVKKGSIVPAMTALLTKFSALKQPREPKFQPRAFPKFTPRTLI